MSQQSSSFLNRNYADFLNGLKERIRSAQIRATLAVNKELIVLYWQIGNEILQRQEQEGWDVDWQFNSHLLIKREKTSNLLNFP